MKKQVLFIHGGSAYSSYDAFLEYLKTATPRNLPFDETVKKWSTTLRDDLGESCEVYMPSMPNSQNAKYVEWKIWFERHFEYMQDNIILVGWSLGGYFLIKYLIENEPLFSVKALFLLASPAMPDDFDGEDGGDFAFNTDDLPQLASKIKKIIIMHSKDDFVVPFEHGEKLAEALPEAEFMVYEDKNHFLIEEFPELVEKIKGLT